MSGREVHLAEIRLGLRKGDFCLACVGGVDHKFEPQGVNPAAATLVNLLLGAPLHEFTQTGVLLLIEESRRGVEASPSGSSEDSINCSELDEVFLAEGKRVNRRAMGEHQRGQSGRSEGRDEIGEGGAVEGL